MFRSIRILSFVPLALLVASAAEAKPRPAFDINSQVTPVRQLDTRVRADGYVASVDEQRGTPTFFWANTQKSLPSAAVGMSSEALARHHLSEHAALYGLTPAALQTARRTLLHDLGHGGVIQVFRQAISGIDIFHSDMKVLTDRQGKLVALSGALHPGATAGSQAKWGGFTLTPADAIAKSLNDLYGANVATSSLVQGKVKSGYDLFHLTAPFQAGTDKHVFVRPARAKKVYFPVAKALVPAFYVEVQVAKTNSNDADVYAYVISAADGRLLMRTNLEASDAFTYRVWADSTAPHTPKDGPLVDFTPHPTGMPDASYPGPAPSTLVTMEAFNTNPMGGRDPWLAADAIETVGNNVDAYTDHTGPDGYDPGVDSRAPLSGAKTFDWTYDLMSDPLNPTTQSSASTTQLFYTNNWMHDYWYDSGFVEATGNAQMVNFGRGGEEGDPLLAEAQDGALDGLRDNANMATPADGESPRMQMYLWTSMPELDGTLDNSIVAHEWGHYIHHRLTDPGTNQAGSQGEGWGDFLALHMGSRQGDNFATGAFAAAQYATKEFGDAGYYGIRRLPYSRDMSKNPFTFKHIADSESLPSIPLGGFGGPNSEVHNAGEIWASMMWEAYTGLILSGKYSFNQAKRKMADYVVGGMIMAPNGPTFTEQRDGILAFAAASDPADSMMLSNQFAQRGAGTCAISPPRYSFDHEGVVESYEIKGRHVFRSATLDDSIKSCDSDGFLDGDEIGKLTFEIANDGALPLTDTVVTVSTPDAGVIFPKGKKVTIASLPAAGKVTASFEVGLVAGAFTKNRIAFDLEAVNAAGCSETVRLRMNEPVGVDDALNVSTLDSVSSNSTAWTPTGASAATIWSRTKDIDGNKMWHGIDSDVTSDTSLETPDIQVGTSGNFIVSFEHRHAFESAFGFFHYDGGVIEISSDGGQTWDDVTNFGANPGYGGTLETDPNGTNPLQGQEAFVDVNPSNPEMDFVALDFKKTFAGQTVRLRFRIGTDAQVGAYGWDIDNIGLLGVVNKPFSDLIADNNSCNGVPVADAGPDQTVMSGDIVQLDGSGSSDPTGDPLTYAWMIDVGPAATLYAAQTPSAVLVAPNVAVPTLMTLSLSVSDGAGSATDTVDVVVNPKPGAGTGGMGGMGGMGGAAGAGGMGGMAGMAGMGGMAGAGGAAGTGGMAGAGGAAGTGGMASSSSSSSSSGEGGAGGGGGAEEPGSCECSAAGDTTSPVRLDALGSLGLVLGMLLRRGRRRNAKN